MCLQEGLRSVQAHGGAEAAIEHEDGDVAEGVRVEGIGLTGLGTIGLGVTGFGTVGLRATGFGIASGEISSIGDVGNPVDIGLRNQGALSPAMKRSNARAKAS